MRNVSRGSKHGEAVKRGHKNAQIRREESHTRSRAELNERLSRETSAQRTQRMQEASEADREIDDREHGKPSL
jgi:hypothetical protein